jgi:hypothetical protein
MVTWSRATRVMPRIPPLEAGDHLDQGTLSRSRIRRHLLHPVVSKVVPGIATGP